MVRASRGARGAAFAGLNSNEALDDPQARHLGILVETEHPVMGKFRTVHNPISFDGTRTSDVTAPPTLDEHGAEVRAELAKGRASAAQ